MSLEPIEELIIELISAGDESMDYALRHLEALDMIIRNEEDDSFLVKSSNMRPVYPNLEILLYQLHMDEIDTVLANLFTLGLVDYDMDTGEYMITDSGVDQIEGNGNEEV